MRTMYTTPAEFAAEVERRAEAAFDVVAPSTAIRVHTSDEGVSKITVDGVEGEFGIRDTAHQQIAQRLHIPIPYYRRMQSEQPALLDANIATWLNASSDRRLLRFLDERLRAYVSDRYQRIDHLRILQVISPIIAQLQGDGARIISSALTDEKMYLKVIVPGIESEIPRPGGDGRHDFRDVVWPGFVISNSETGHGTFKVEQMIYRHVCSNGLIMGEKLAVRHLGSRITEADGVFSDRTRRLDDETILSAARDLVTAAVDEAKFHALVSAFGEAHQTAPSVDPVQTVEILGKSHDLSEGERTKVLRAFTLDAGDNGLGLFGLVNAVTRASQEVEDYERATEMETLGGKLLLDTSDREWLRLAGVAS